MAEGKYSKSDPSVLLLNEIDILLAQTRLMELYLKQAQATAANETAKIDEQHQAELTVLRASLVEKEQAVLHQSAVIAQQQNMAERVDQIESQLKQKQQLLDTREREVEAGRADIAALHGQIAQLEVAVRQAQAAALQSTTEREKLHAETAALRQQMESNQRDFHEQQLRASEREQGLHGQLTRLQTELSEKQIWSQNAARELAHARSEIASLQKILAELQAIHEEAESRAVVELGQSRALFEAQMASLQADLAAHELLQQESSLARGEMEETLRRDIAGLSSELEQKRQELAEEAAAQGAEASFFSGEFRASPPRGW